MTNILKPHSLRAFLRELLAGPAPHEGELVRLPSKVGEGLSVQALEPVPARSRSR